MLSEIKANPIWKDQSFKTCDNYKARFLYFRNDTKQIIRPLRVGLSRSFFWILTQYIVLSRDVRDRDRDQKKNFTGTGTKRKTLPGPEP